MSELIQFLKHNPMLLLFGVVWLFSLIGGATRSAARRAAAEAERVRQRKLREEEARQSAEPVAKRPVTPAGQRPDLVASGQRAALDAVSGQRADLTGDLTRPDLASAGSQPAVGARPDTARQRRAKAARTGTDGSDRTSGANRNRRSAEEVSAELRRMMGLDEGPDAAEPVRYDSLEFVEDAPPVAGRPVEPEEPVIPKQSHGGNLLEQLEAKEVARAKRTENRIERRAEEFESRLADRHLNDDLLSRASTAAIGQREQRRTRRRGQALQFDASDPIRAIIAMEVLGPPRAMREWE